MHRVGCTEDLCTTCYGLIVVVGRCPFPNRTVAALGFDFCPGTAHGLIGVDPLGATEPIILKFLDTSKQRTAVHRSKTSRIGTVSQPVSQS